MKTVIQTPTSSLRDSLNFYSKLDFKILSKKSPTLVSDGGFLIEINDDRFARAGLKLYSDSWEVEVKKLEKLTSVIKVDKGYLLSDPSGMWIYLIESKESFSYNISKQPSVLGSFAGISLESVGIEKSIDILKLLGFEKTSGTIEQGWISFENEDQLPITLMKPNSCPHLFYNPSFTYFNGGKNLPVIKKIRKLNISIVEEITHFNKEGVVDNIIIRDPGGFGFFIFND